MKRHWKSGSDLVEKLFDDVERYKEIGENCYKTCNDILRDETVNIGELYHAKAVLEQKMEKRSDIKNTVNSSLSLGAICIAASSLLKSTLERLLITILVVVACVTIYYFVDNSHIKDYMYYVHSLICDEIERRNKEECQNK